MYSHNLKWHKLKENKCPKCGKDWIFDLTTMPVTNKDGSREQLLAHGCGFQIRESRYKQIVSGMITQDIDRQRPKGGDIDE